MLFDADCGFCTRSATALVRWGGQVELMAWQLADLEGLGVDPRRASSELPVVLPDGQVRYGAKAVAAALGTGGWPLAVAGRIVGASWLSWLSDRCYRWVAAHRHQLPGGTGSCALPPPG